MKSIVIYFSQTGNTKKVAEVIQKEIKSATGQCDIVRIQDADARNLVNYDLIGLGCPTFAHREPENVRRFITGLGPLRGKHCFLFSTHGGHPSNVLTSMDEKLDQLGLKVIGGFNCDGSDHMPHFSSPWYTEGHPDEADLRMAADFGRRMAELSQRIYRGEKVLLPAFQWDSLGVELTRESVANKPISEGFALKMTLDQRKCRYPKCRLCVENCPVAAIDLSADPIIFRKGCISCYFCEMICPTGAIEADPESVESRRKVVVERLNMRQYPEFFERAKAELISNRSTLYRMLVDKVEIGNSEEMHEPALRRRPRYVIRDRE